MTADPTPDLAATPYLQGLLSPVYDERDDRDLAVIGEIPAGLRGMFVRNGPNPQFAPLGGYHPFDGDGMLHAVYFEDGRARYRNRWVESKGLLVERKRGRSCYGGLGEFRLPVASVLEEAGPMKNVANTHFVRHAGRYFALMEAGPPTEMSRELETLGEYDFDGKLVGPMTAHPKLDPRNGELLFFGYSPFPPHLRYHVADASGALVHSVDIDLPASVMIHDFAFTERHAIFIDSPAIFDVEAMMRGEPAMRWEPDRGTRIGVMPRRGTADELRWFEIDNGYVVHFFNAWETGDAIEIRAPRFAEMPGGFDFENPRANGEPIPWRWTIDLGAGLVREEQTDDRAGEFPRVNDDRAGRRTRFGYNCPARTWEFEFEFHGVVKYDIETGASQAHYYNDTSVSGEHVFAPNPDGSAEDDGWLLSFVSDRATEQSELVILDARDIEAEPLARVRMARRVPIGFHANWIPEA